MFQNSYLGYERGKDGKAKKDSATLWNMTLLFHFDGNQ